VAIGVPLLKEVILLKAIGVRPRKAIRHKGILPKAIGDRLRREEINNSNNHNLAELRLNREDSRLKDILRKATGVLPLKDIANPRRDGANRLKDMASLRLNKAVLTQDSNSRGPRSKGSPRGKDLRSSARAKVLIC